MRDTCGFAEMRERLFIAGRAAFGHTVLHSVVFFSLFTVVKAVYRPN